MKRKSKGCWTCRLRRKKCDEQRPICRECRTLHISTCSYGDRPAWMDGGTQQEAMAEQIKKEVKQQAPYRQRRRTGSESGSHKAPTADPGHQTEASSLVYDTGSTPAEALEPGSSVNTDVVCKQILRMRPFSQSDSVLLMFYLERVLPFLFPFYRPAPLHGSRAWILDLVISSPVIRQAILCQSSYFFASAQPASLTTNSQMWEGLLEQTRDAFNMLRGSIQVIDSVHESESILGSARAMAAIVQLQRFETAIGCFDNCQAHLGAAISVFERIIDVVGATNLETSSLTFQTISNFLGPQTSILSTHQAQAPSSEQAAFSFSLALLLFDDIIASTVLQERPKLHAYHHSLLCKCGGVDGNPCINLEALIGCQNWVLWQIGEIAALNAWKKNCKAAGNLDIVELANRMISIKKTLETRLSQLNSNLEPNLQKSRFADDPFIDVDFYGQARTMTRESSLVTQIWAHSALIYLSVIGSGWQPANTDVRRHVTLALELLRNNMMSPSLLRTMAWPICLVGSLAESAQQTGIRRMVNSLQPTSRFSTVRRGFEIIEKVWKDISLGGAEEFAAYFRDEGALVLLV